MKYTTLFWPFGNVLSMKRKGLLLTESSINMVIVYGTVVAIVMTQSLFRRFRMSFGK
jgi:hypothetical protein